MSANTNTYGDAPIFGIVPLTVTRALGIAANRFIKADGSAYAATAESSAGVSSIAVTAAQVTAGQNEINTAVAGIKLCEAGGVIAANALVELEGGTATGRVVSYSSGAVRGKALAASGAAADIIPVLLSPASP